MRQRKWQEERAQRSSSWRLSPSLLLLWALPAAMLYRCTRQGRRGVYYIHARTALSFDSQACLSSRGRITTYIQQAHTFVSFFLRLYCNVHDALQKRREDPTDANWRRAQTISWLT